MEGTDQKGWDSGGAAPHPTRRRPTRELLGDDSGVIYVEYIVLVLLVGILVALAIIAVGVPLLESFRMTQSFLGAPIP